MLSSSSLTHLSFWGLVAFFVQAFIVLAVTLRVMLTRHPPGASFAWILVTTILPYAGFFLYLMFGERPIGRLRAARQKKAIARWARIANHKLTPLGPLPRFLVRHRSFIHLATRLGGMPLTTGSLPRLLGTSQDVIESLLRDICRAEHSIAMTFYIWENGGEIDRITEAILAARARGVRVRILLDAFGSRAFLRSAAAQRFRNEGVELSSAMPMRFWKILGLQRADLRMHRKLVVIDDTVAYTGSFNMIDPTGYDAAVEVGAWVDAMVRLEGPAVISLLAVWRFDWALQPDEDLSDLEHDYALLDMPNRGPAGVVTIPSGPYDKGDQSLHLVIETINRAERTLSITTPYFVPNEAVVIALVNAALRGVRVELIVPHRTDSCAVAWATRRYFDDLLKAGVKILYFEGGLLHTKAVAVDEEFVLFGTLNIDNRSMHLNFELSLLIFDAGFAEDFGKTLERYRTSCVPIDPERWRRRPVIERLKEGASYLISPLL